MADNIEKEIPSFLKYFPSYIQTENLSFNEAHTLLVNSISQLYTLGWRYEDCLQVKEIYQARDYIAKLDARKHYAFADKLIAYVFTQGKIYNPFGKWIEFDYAEPLIALDLAMKLKEKNNSGIHLLPLANIIFVLYKITEGNDFEKIKTIMRYTKNGIKNNIFPEETKNNKLAIRSFISEYWKRQDIALFEVPNSLYQKADICQPTAKKYLEFLGIEIKYEFYMSRKNYKTRLWLAGYKSVIKQFRETYSKNRDRYNRLSNKDCLVTNMTNILKDNSILSRMCNNYETRFINDKMGYNQFSALPYNPLIRRKSEKKMIIQAEFLNLSFLLYSLYWDKKKKQLNNSVKNNTEIKIANCIKKELKSNKEKIIGHVYNILKDHNLAGKVWPISSIDEPKATGEHFKQADLVSPIVMDISRNGILVDRFQANNFLQNREKVAEQLKREISYSNDNDYKQQMSEILVVEKTSFGKSELISFAKNSNEILNEYLLNLKLFKEDSREDIEAAINELEKILQSSSGDMRVYGSFTTHRANTHRMTCSNINLQGLSKEYRNKLFKAPSGYVLLSADVSGQDITVAANLAQKVYSDPIFRATHQHTELELLQKGIKITLSKLRNTDSAGEELFIHKPIDFITHEILGRELPELNNISRQAIRNAVKQTVYIRFYGGGMKTVIDELKAECVSDLESRKEIVVKNLEARNTSFFHRDEIYVGEDFEAMLASLKKYKDFLDASRSLMIIPDLNLFDAVAEIDTMINSCQQTIENINVISCIFKLTEQILRQEYPGLLDIYVFLKEYVALKENPLNLSYPSILGWQTVFEELTDFNADERTTRSKCYPIQASGAEFIRMWIYYLSEITDYGKTFKIVNVIHDQVIIEVKNSDVEKMKAKLLETAKKAANSVGILPDTLHIPTPEIIGEDKT